MIIKNFSVVILKQKLAEVSGQYHHHMSMSEEDKRKLGKEWHYEEQLMYDHHINDLYSAIALLNVVGGRSIVINTQSSK